MKEYKVCPICNTKNPPNLFACVNCKASLFKVDPTDDESDGKINKANIYDESEPETVRVCEECGTNNPSNVRKCKKCGNDISDSDILPSVGSTISTKTKPHIEFKSIDGKYSFEVTEEKTIIGRAQNMREYLSEKGYVARVQASITIEDDGFYIENMGSSSRSNPTFVNNIEITEKTRLNDGDEIGLGGKVINGKRQEKAAYFIVRII